jgi:zinc-ribbon domain
MSSDSLQPLPEQEEKQLCTNCAAPNEPSVHFCVKCGAPLSSFATFAPFERILAEGFIYRQAANCPRSLITVLGVWLIFGFTALTGLSLLSFVSNSGDGGTIMGVVFGVPMILFSLVMIWKTTRNYFARRQIDHKDDN